MNTPLRRLPIGLLLVEDSPADARLLSESLREVPGAEDAIIRTVRSLSEARTELARFSFTCVLLDLGLPDGRGIDNIQVLREIDRSVAIVVLTGNDDERLASEAIRLGAQDYLVKGQYDAEKILRLMRHAIQRNRHVHEMEDDRHREIHRATHDALTGLANRGLFHDRLAHHLEWAQAGGSAFAVCSLDLDGFKAVHDHYGHRQSDELMLHVAAILTETVNQADSVARVGSDEFLLLLDLAGDIEDPLDLARRLRARIQAIEPVGDQAIRLDASMGIVTYPAHAGSVDELLERADQARAEARQSGAGVALYSLAASAASEDDVELKAQLHQVLVENRFSLLYQPWVDADSGQMVGLKLAPRWEGSGVEPGEAFLRGVAAIGCASELSLHVIAAALEQQKRWLSRGFLLPPLAIRLGEFELDDEGFLPALQHLLEAAGLTPGRLQILVAVSALGGARAPHVLARLQRVRAEGFGLVLDAFSAEGEAFKWLTALPLDGVRLAPRVIRALRDEAGGGAPQRFITALQAGAAAIGVPVIATAVDDDLERRRLQALGCRCLQGSLYGPVDATTLETRLSIVSSTSNGQRNDAHA